MKSCSPKHRVYGWLVAMVISVSATGASAGVAGNAIWTAGTTWQDTRGTNWAYITWSTTPVEILAGRQFAVYLNDGQSGGGDAFQRIAVVGLQTDPHTLRILLRQSERLGGDRRELRELIDGVYEDSVAVGIGDDSSDVERLAAVMQCATTDAVVFNRLRLVGRSHPGVAMSLGTAFATPMPPAATWTFEIREHESVTSVDGVVVGRVAVTAGQWTPLPSPSGLRAVEEMSPKGHLNIRLQWDTSAALRRKAPQHFGYNLYRMSYKNASGSGYTHGAPPRADFLELATLHPEIIHGVNERPILLNNRAPGAGTFSYIDDRLHYSGAGEDVDRPFKNGERFYYFVTARDVLGRDGLISTGALAMACHRLPPYAPRDVKARVAYTYDRASDTSRQDVRVTWRDEASTAVDPFTGYYVYRWASLADMHQRAGDPATEPVSEFIWRTGTNRYAFVDRSVEQDLVGETIWYTVRADYESACGSLLSADSAPAFVSLRDWEGPPPTSNTWFTYGLETIDVHGSARTLTPNADDLDFRVACRRSNSGVVWAECWYEVGGIVTTLGRKAFDSSMVSFDVPYGSVVPKVPVVFYCRASTSMGRKATASVVAEATGFRSSYVKVSFDAVVAFEDTTFTNAIFGPVYPPAIPQRPGDEIASFETCAEVPPGDVEEWRFYRRIDQGSLRLIGQGTVVDSNVPVCVTDYPPANAAEVCYYVQFIDGHGNPGPLTRLDCVESLGGTALDTPVLHRLRAVTNGTDSAFTAEWFCSPAGVARFEVAVATGLDSIRTTLPPPVHLSADLSTNLFPELAHLLLGEFEQDYAIYETQRVGAGLGDGESPLFAVDIACDPGLTYFLSVRAVAEHDRPAESTLGWSNVESFRWTSPSTTPMGTQVPWPDRALPPVHELPEVRADVINVVTDVIMMARVGVRIGTIPWEDIALRADGETPDIRYNPDLKYDPQNPHGEYRTVLEHGESPDRYVFGSESGQSLFPMVLYRRQVPSELLPDVSGDTCQVSPLMTSIAYQVSAGHSLIRDPYIIVRPHPDGPGVDFPYQLYLVDTQPVIRGAAYQYMLLRFTDRWEPSDVINVPPLVIE